MYYSQDRLFCGVCNKSVLPAIYPNHFKSQGLINTVLKSQCKNSLISATQYKKR